MLRSLLVAPTDYGVLCLVFVLLGATPLFLAAYGLLALGTTGYLLLALPRWRNEMAASVARTGRRHELAHHHPAALPPAAGLVGAGVVVVLAARRPVPLHPGRRAGLRRRARDHRPR